MIPKKDLKHGCYYAGECRNAGIARWDGRFNAFFFKRHKFGHTYVESIRHLEDEADTRWDGFQPLLEIPEPDEPIPLP